MSDMLRLIELYQIIKKKEDEMTDKLGEIQSLRRDVDLDRAELVNYYREFTEWCYGAYGRFTAFAESMLTVREMKYVEEIENGKSVVSQ